MRYQHKVIIFFGSILAIIFLSGCPSRTHIKKVPIKPTIKPKPSKDTKVKPKPIKIKPIKKPKLKRSASLTYIPLPTHPAFKKVLRRELRNKWFNRSILTRKGFYAHKIIPLLQKNGMAKELILIAGIESNYRTRVVSPARAMGLWQFIRSTGRHYGLKRDQWKDERRNIEKATKAAASYFKFLFNKFHSWELAISSYNCGEGRVERILKRCPNMNFWTLRTNKECGLPRETKQYVARFFTLLYLLRHPYPKRIIMKRPIHLKKVILKKTMNLVDLAQYLAVSVRRLHYWNPELSSWATPPISRYPFLVPAKYLPKLRRFLRKKLGYHLKTYKIRNDKGLQRLARRHRLKINFVRSINHRCLKRRRKKTRRPRHRIRRYSNSPARILLPVPVHGKRWQGRRTKSLLSLSKRLRKYYPRLFRCGGAHRRRLPCYIVQDGDSFWHIGKRYHIPYRKLMRWNRRSARALRQGQILRLTNKGKCYRCRKHRRKKICFKPYRNKISNRHCYRIKKGDRLWKISKKFNIKIKALKRWNHGRYRRLYVGQLLRLAPNARCRKKRRKKYRRRRQ